MLCGNGHEGEENEGEKKRKEGGVGAEEEKEEGEVDKRKRRRGGGRRSVEFLGHQVHIFLKHLHLAGSSSNMAAIKHLAVQVAP